MKQETKNNLLALTIIFLILFGIGYFIKSMWFEEGSYLVTEDKNGDSIWRLKTAGLDLRVYEFTPQTNQSKQCVFVAGSGKAGLFCFDKE